jgi:uncharacterized protein
LGAIALLLSWIPEVAAEFDTAITDWYEFDFQSGERDMEVFAHGTFLEIMEQRALNVVYTYTSSIVVIPAVLMSFLAGLYAVKRGILNNLEGHLPLFRRILFLALVIGLPANVLLVISYELASESWAWWFCALMVHSLAGPALMLAYVSAIVLLYQQEHWRRRFNFLAPVGRMALTNYLMQSLVCTTIFYSYGLGHYGQVGMGAGVSIATLVFLAQIPLSHWWLNRFQFGPVEWLWRSVTYRKLQPMRYSKEVA